MTKVFGHVTADKHPFKFNSLVLTLPSNQYIVHKVRSKYGVVYEYLKPSPTLANKQNRIARNKLIEELYFKQQVSTEMIAKRFNISVSLVQLIVKNERDKRQKKLSTTTKNGDTN